MYYGKNGPLRSASDVPIGTRGSCFCCHACQKPPELGQTLWPGPQWLCLACREQSIPGKDSISKSMSKTIEYANLMQEAFSLESEGREADTSRNQAEWARWMAVEIKNQGVFRARNAARSNGEIIPEAGSKRLQEAISVREAAEVEASLDRSGLLLQDGLDVAAMAIDAKEGGFLGFGGVQVSDAEKVTLAEMSSALGLKG
jgi:hypothetical protein